MEEDSVMRSAKEYANDAVYLDLRRAVMTAMNLGVSAAAMKELLAEAWAECLHDEAKAGAKKILS